MRILYIALDQTVPGTVGGSVHVQAVADGLASLGHEVHVACQIGHKPEITSGVISGEIENYTRRRFWHHLAPPFSIAQLRWARRGAVEQLAREVGAEVIIERYYNFGGEGVLAADAIGIPSVLEVNAPIIDYPGSPKRMLDRVLLVEPMRRWRERLCRLASLFVTPTASILPEWIDRRRVLEIEWGADVDRFHPGAAMRTPPVDGADSDRIQCVFAGAFRRWHGAIHLAHSLARRHRAGDRRFSGVFIGDGPERRATQHAAAGIPSVTFTGRVPHDDLPPHLAAADIGVAPFDSAAHPPLQLSFYWSPLKIFEYMATGLPVVAPALPRLTKLVEHGREGWLYDPADPQGLDNALIALAENDRRRALGAAARDRVVRDFSWTAHCRALAARLGNLHRQ